MLTFPSQGSGDTSHKPAVADSSALDTVFAKLHLSPDGVYGVDLNGNEWEYDFSRDLFTRAGSSNMGTVEIFRKGTARGLRLDESLQANIDSLQADIDSLRVNIYSTIKKRRGLQLGSVEIGPDEKIAGPVVAIGTVTVKGLVEGDVISYDRIIVTSTGEITGDARAPEVTKMRGGIIGGRRYETDIPKIPEIDLFRETSYTAIIANSIILGALLFCGFLAVLIIPRPLTRIKDCLHTKFMRAFFVGFITWLLFAPAFALLCLTIIGIPIAILVLPIALLLGVIMGSLGMGQLIGGKIDNYSGGRYNSQLLQVIVGLAILYMPWIIMSLFIIPSSGVSHGFSIFFRVIAIIVSAVGVTAGMGSVILTRFGSRECGKAKMEISIKIDSAPSPPPPPSPPPLKTD